MVAVTNWHLLQETGDELAEVEAEDEELEVAGIVPDAHDVVRQVLPVVPGRATGNSLDVLDNRWARGRVIAFLQALPDLLVFNDAAHLIHDLRKAGEAGEVEGPKSLSRLAQGQGRRLVTVDFSAKPHTQPAGPG